MVQPGWKAILVTTTAAVIAESLRQAGVVGEDAGAAWVYGTLRPLMDDILALMLRECLLTLFSQNFPINLSFKLLHEQHDINQNL